MLAVIQQIENGYIARFERHLKHSVEKVWSSLTENDKLAKWFSELRVDDLREGGIIKFDMQDGTFEELEIIELKCIPYWNIHGEKTLFVLSCIRNRKAVVWF